MNEFIDIRGEAYSESDKEFDKKLRPLQFNDFRGQNQVVENLKVFVQAAKLRGESVITSYSIHYTKLYEVFFAKL